MTGRPPRGSRPCPHCGAAVVWAVTEAGKRQPLNAVPDESGNVAAYRDASGVHRARSLGPAGSPWRHERVYMPHAATCTGPRQPLPPGPNQLAAAAGPPLPPGVADFTAYRARKTGTRGTRR